MPSSSSKYNLPRHDPKLHFSKAMIKIINRRPKLEKEKVVETDNTQSEGG